MEGENLIPRRDKVGTDSSLASGQRLLLLQLPNPRAFVFGLFILALVQL
jgi:hypothetical protein